MKFIVVLGALVVLASGRAIEANTNSRDIAVACMPLPNSKTCNNLISSRDKVTSLETRLMARTEDDDDWRDPENDSEDAFVRYQNENRRNQIPLFLMSTSRYRQDANNGILYRGYDIFRALQAARRVFMLIAPDHNNPYADTREFPDYDGYPYPHELRISDYRMDTYEVSSGAGNWDEPIYEFPVLSGRPWESGMNPGFTRVLFNEQGLYMGTASSVDEPENRMHWCPEVRLDGEEVLRHDPVYPGVDISVNYYQPYVFMLSWVLALQVPGYARQGWPGGSDPI
ncbi:uncharacterized protein BCR38DRAFT_407522 [Pseudomassariella vexata]|uniref:Uncharacterized protein n=1 Tax=Pseudomassariella vexata TaxID=1141098 RepID=A0A1Y2E7L8_9PEZI|nr:uncharacterized protein BCR38DRAFT_407522 [Pseudomassariella vexata]ORY67558.1 hypothetical protein BCR38DRAFT_407522 [Pseudomassariella vexata]